MDLMTALTEMARLYQDKCELYYAIHAPYVPPYLSGGYLERARQLLDEGGRTMKTQCQR